MIHTVIFDVGGTLVKARSSLKGFAERLDPNNKEAIVQFLIDEFMKIYRIEKPKQFIGIKEIIAIILKKASDKFDVEDLSGQAFELYGKMYLDNVQLFNDTLPTLKKLKENNIKMFVASDADPDVLIEELSKFNIYDYFDDIIISGNIGAYKPSDKMTNAIISICNKPYSDILFVGDTDVDIFTGQKMGAKSILINRNGDFKVNADYCITDLNQIFEVIENLK